MTHLAQKQHTKVSYFFAKWVISKNKHNQLILALRGRFIVNYTKKALNMLWIAKDDLFNFIFRPIHFLGQIKVCSQTRAHKYVDALLPHSPTRRAQFLFLVFFFSVAKEKMKKKKNTNRQKTIQNKNKNKTKKTKTKTKIKIKTNKVGQKHYKKEFRHHRI